MFYYEFITNIWEPYTAMKGKAFKELVCRIPDDAEMAHLWDGGFAWRSSGTLHAYSFKPDFLTDAAVVHTEW